MRSEDTASAAKVLIIRNEPGLIEIRLANRFVNVQGAAIESVRVHPSLLVYAAGARAALPVDQHATPALSDHDLPNEEKFVRDQKERNARL
jgi:hypothetical protein